MKMLFIVGTGRCGSTFVHEILAKHRDLGFVSNIEDNLLFLNRLGRINNALYASTLGNFTGKGKLRFAPSEAYRLISREVSPIYANSSRDLTSADVTPWLDQRFKKFFLSRAQAQRKPVFSHKYTGWSRIGFFKHIFPDAKFLHVVRDGRAVANSWLQMPWWGGYRGPENWLWGNLQSDLDSKWRKEDRSYIALAALGWRLLMESYRTSTATLGRDSYFEVRYEDVLEAPEDRFEQIVHFSGLDFSDSFVGALRRQKIEKGRRRAFEHDLTKDQIAQMERCIGPILTEYGYQ